MRKIVGLIVLFITMVGCKSVEEAADARGQKKGYKILTIAFYNLENLFDTIDDPTTFDEYSPIMKLPSERREEVYQKKLQNMAYVISRIGVEMTKNMPAVIGVCEIENRQVLEDLVHESSLIANNYGIIHFKGPDERSIDVALLYQKSLFRPIKSSTYSVLMYQADEPTERDYTRDQLVVTGLLDGDKMSFVINHWPSRSGGQVASEYRRLAAAGVNKRIIDSLQIIDPYAKIITMGDFNDNPNDKSIKEVLNAERTPENVELKGLYNPYEKLYERGIGSGAYRDSWDLFDQIIISKPFLNNDYGSYRFYRAFVYNPNYLLTPRGEYRGYPFRSYSNGEFTGGYSDHFPVYIYLIKETDE